MRRAQQDRPSIVVSEQLTTKILPMTLPMTPGHAPHFDSLEDGFFKEGDDLSDWQPTTDDFNDPTRVCKPDRRLARRWPLYGAAIGVACILGFVLLGRARSRRPPKSRSWLKPSPSFPQILPHLPRSPNDRHLLLHYRRPGRWRPIHRWMHSRLVGSPSIGTAPRTCSQPAPRPSTRLRNRRS